jgi:hypothetical protein
MKRISMSALRRALLAGAVLVSGAAVPAFAHHSFAMFDQDKIVEVNGTLTKLELVNPHCWLNIIAPDKQGKAVVWSIEMAAVGQVKAMGMTDDTVKPGDKLTVSIHPLRNGAVGGSFVSAKLADGRELVHAGVATRDAVPVKP